MSEIHIRHLVSADATAVLRIYAPFIENSAITFEYEIPAEDEFRERITRIAAAYPFLVAEHQGAIVGYAYAGRFRERAAYQWCCESSVYVDPAYLRRGIARSLYRELFKLLQAQGMRNVYAVITLPNPESVALHTAFGFTEAGLFRKAGYKHEQWHDVLFMEKFLAAHDLQPAPPF